MKKYILPSLFVALLVIVFLFGKSCNKPIEPIPTSFNTSDLRMKEELIKKLKAELKPQIVEVEVLRDRWHKAKHDTIPCDSAIVIQRNISDTLILKDSILISSQAIIINKQDSVITGWHTAHASDSTTIVKLNKEIKRQKRQKWLIIAGGSVIVAGLIIR